MHSKDILEKMARDIARRNDLTFVPRNRASFTDATLVLEKHSLILYSKNKEAKLFFHPSMARIRIGKADLHRENYFIRALDVKEGDHILDCTLGLATDAIVAAQAVGKEGKITGLESEKLIAQIVRTGMDIYYDEKNLNWQEIFSRIEVRNENYKNYLSSLEDNSFDIVYFDPMFETSITTSDSISPLRKWANFEYPDQNDILQAVRVARRRVVMKSHKHDPILDKLGFTSMPTKRKIQFGYISCNHSCAH